MECVGLARNVLGSRGPTHFCLGLTTNGTSFTSQSANSPNFDDRIKKWHQKTETGQMVASAKLGQCRRSRRPCLWGEGTGEEGNERLRNPCEVCLKPENRQRGCEWPFTTLYVVIRNVPSQRSALVMLIATASEHTHQICSNCDALLQERFRAMEGFCKMLDCLIYNLLGLSTP